MVLMVRKSACACVLVLLGLFQFGGSAGSETLGRLAAPGGVPAGEFGVEPVGSGLAFVDSFEAARSAFPTAIQEPAPASPPYVYAPGYYGYGYYAAAAAPSAPAAAPSRAAAPARSGNPPRQYREFGTGRSIRLAKPWLRQF